MLSVGHTLITARALLVSPIEKVIRPFVLSFSFSLLLVAIRYSLFILLFIKLLTGYRFIFGIRQQVTLVTYSYLFVISHRIFIIHYLFISYLYIKNSVIEMESN